jgi:uncharacterized protein YggE
MKSTLTVVSITILCFMVSAQSTVGQDRCPHPRLISVSGTAETNVEPDEVILTVAVQSRDRDLAIAKSQHDVRMKKIIAETGKSGVEPKYVQTSSLEMMPAYSEEKTPRLLAYEVTQTIQITLKDLSKYEMLVTKLLENGVNRIDGVEFQIADSRKYKDETRLRAIRAAKEKATAMAAELGQTIGKPWEINEETGDGAYGYANTRVMAGAMAPAISGPTVAPGQITVRSSVRVSFQLD